MTIFEKIIAREIDAEIVYEDEHCIAFHDVSPQAPVHLLIVPKKPIPRICDATKEDRKILGHMLWQAGEIARDLGIDSPDKGFRLIMNNGKDGGESVPHLHMHMLAGRSLSWPPG